MKCNVRYCICYVSFDKEYHYLDHDNDYYDAVLKCVALYSKMKMDMVVIDALEERIIYRT